MAYTPTVWVTGDKITAEKLNKEEQGIAMATPMLCSIVFASEDSATMNQTYDDIVTALTAGRTVNFVNVDADYGIICNYMLIGTFDAVDPTPNEVLVYGQDPKTGSLAQFMFAEDTGVLTWTREG